MVGVAGEAIGDGIRLARWQAANRGLVADIDDALLGMESALLALVDRPGTASLAELHRAGAELVDVADRARAVAQSGVTGFDRARVRALALLALAGERVLHWDPTDATDSRGTDALMAMGLARKQLRSTVELTATLLDEVRAHTRF